MKGAAAASSEPMASAARAMLARGGSAVDAVIAAFFAAAALDESVLFAPASALVHGVGAGPRAFDARSLQPGLDASRPRGLKPGQISSDAARVAVPRTIRLVALLHSLHGRKSLGEAAKPAVVLAKKEGNAERASLLADIGDLGAAALERSRTRELLFAVASTPAGGALTEGDLDAALPREVAVMASPLGDGVTYRVPWGSQPGPAAAASQVSVVVAGDPWGLCALLSFERGRTLMVPGLGSGLPLRGVPVRRGVPRTPPGTPLPSPAPLAIVDRGPDLRVVAAVALSEASRTRILGPDDLELLATTTPVDDGVRELAARLGSGLVVMAVEKKGPRIIVASDAAA